MNYYAILGIKKREEREYLVIIIMLISCEVQCNQAREQNFLKPYFWAKNYTDKPT